MRFGQILAVFRIDDIAEYKIVACCIAVDDLSAGVQFLETRNRRLRDALDRRVQYVGDLIGLRGTANCDSSDREYERHDADWCGRCRPESYPSLGRYRQSHDTCA
jgi:hypothetical protein